MEEPESLTELRLEEPENKVDGTDPYNTQRCSGKLAGKTIS